MRNFALISSLAVLLSVSAGHAGGVEPHQVVFKMEANQQSLRDSSKNDVYKSSIRVNGWANSSLEVTCSSGSSGFLGMVRRDETCKLSGKGMVNHPTTGAEHPRLLYSGGFVVKSDGYTDAQTIVADYQKLGGASAQPSTFGGSLMMKPENPAKSASELRDSLVSYLQKKATGSQGVSISTEMDSIRFEQFKVPNVGGRGTVDCAWTGDMIYAYANDAWQMNFTAKCGDVSYKLEGNMPWIDVEGQDHQAEYVLNLMIAGAGGNDPFAEADPFAQVDGIVGTIKMTTSNMVEVKISDTETDKVPVSIVAEGNLVGTNVPADLTYSFGQIMALFARTYFGA